MVERAVGWGLVHECVYTAIDEQAENIAHSQERLQRWADQEGFHLVTTQTESGWQGQLTAPQSPLRTLILQRADIFDFATRPQEQGRYDLLIAHAVLDLFDIAQALPPLLALLRPGGLFYFTINFDGITHFEPAIDLTMDAQIEALYHRTMDERITAGQPSGDSRTGRHLFTALPAAGGVILAAGPSDWVVHPQPDGGYPADEAYFLHFIVETMYNALHNHPELNNQAFTEWIARRQAQIQAGELVYIAHQLDFFGMVRPESFDIKLAAS